MLFAPIERDLPQRLGAEFKPGRLDLVPPKTVLEMPEGAYAVVLILCYLAFFASCIGPVFWTILPAIRNNLRSTDQAAPLSLQNIPIDL